ncbi:flavin reductase family protein [Gilvimarinus chinensis]|uniref:flavin reductase family protein n=1 Tax=Gilvimarinus chinensis TaxID=396005 RepID=UPI000362C7BC|nr:flavin reductase [Gilvimarinus chinensis]
MQFDRNAIDAMPQRQRAHFINSLSGYKSANLIGTQDAEGHHNLAIVSSVFHLGANPPLIGLIFRPHSVERHSLENMLATGHFTLNQVNGDIYRQAHQSSARYPRQISEFAAVGLTPETLPDIKAPFVGESHLKLALQLVEVQTLCNDTELVIGEIQTVIVPATAVAADGHVAIESLDAVAVSGLDHYHLGHPLERLEYAKPDRAVRSLVPPEQQ